MKKIVFLNITFLLSALPLIAQGAGNSDNTVVTVCMALDVNRDLRISDSELRPLSDLLGSWSKAVEARPDCEKFLRNSSHALAYSKNEEMIYDGFEYFVINLARSRQRLERIAFVFLAAGIRFTRIEGVLGKKLDLLALREKGIYKPAPFPKRWLKPAEIGIYMSQRKLWEKFLGGKAQFAVVFEDDVKFGHDLHDKVLELVAQAPTNWSILYLGCHGSHHAKFFLPCRPENNRQVLGAPMVELDSQCVAGTWAYVINRSSAASLLANTLPIEWPIDFAIKNDFVGMQKTGEFRAYCASPEIVKMTGASSEIGSRGNCKDIACAD